MRVFRTLAGIALAAAALISARVRARADAVGLAPPPAPAPREREGRHRMALVARTALLTLLTLTVIAVLGGSIFMLSGFYDISAIEPHLTPVRWALETARTRSVAFHARSVDAPDLRNPAMVREGLPLYHQHCSPCHGAPGVAPEQLGVGINPTPPPLMSAVASWTNGQIYWIVAEGLKMSGMPSFRARLSEPELWSIVAFLRRLPWLSARQYQDLRTAALGGTDAEWLLDGDQGLARLAAEGDPRTGHELLGRYGCGACHRFPGGGSGETGPPLTRYVERHFIAGKLVNTPNNLAAWIMNPRRINPGSAMPDLGVGDKEAFHIVSYLYTLGDPKRLDGIREVVAAER